MLLAYLLFAVVAGLAASVISFVMYSSFLISAVVYVLVGTFAAILLPVILVARGANFGKYTAEMDEMDSLSTVQSLPAREGTENSMRILAVDDDPFILELIPMLSEKAGFPSVTVASSGTEALQLLSNSDMRFDCFLFDISMPEMDGIELCSRVRQMPHYAKTPILMLTAMRDLNNMGNAYRAGATDYATKPFDIEELTTRLNMAQRSILAGRTDGWVSVGAQTASRSDFSASATGLVDEAAMVSYLTQLPKKQAAAVQVYAFAFDDVKAEHIGPNPHHSILQLQKVILAVAGSFDAGQSLMTCTHDSTLLVASTLAASQSNIDIEAKIERVLRGMGYHIAVAMGGPVIPQGSKSERAKIAIDRALTLALIRNHEKRDPEYFDAKSSFGGRA